MVTSSQSVDVLVERLSDRVFVEVVSDVCVEQAAIPVVGHVTSVVDSRDQELERLPWSVIILIQVQAQQVL